MNQLFLFTDFMAGLVFILTGKVHFGSFLNLSTFFSVLWMVVGMGANLCLFDYYPPSDYVNVVMLAGALVFHIIVMAVPSNQISLRVVDRLRQMERVRFQLIVIFNIVCLIIMLPLLGEAIQTISTSGWTLLRTMNFDASYGYKTVWQTYLIDYFVDPCRVATLITGLLMTLERDRQGYYILAIGALNAFMSSFINAGRGSVLNIVILGIFCIVVKSGSIKGLINKIPKKIIVPLILASLAFVLIVTSDRSADDSSIGAILYQYYFSGPVFLTQLLDQNFLGFEIDQNFMLGWATFGFLVNIPLTLGLVLGLGTKTSVYWIGSYLTSHNLPISPALSSNAMCTCYYDFLLDWGTAGAIIGPALLGFSTIFISLKLKQTNSLFWASVMAYWLDILFRTTFRWDPVDIAFTLTICFMGLFSYCPKRQKRKLEK